MNWANFIPMRVLHLRTMPFLFFFVCCMLANGVVAQILSIDKTDTSEYAKKTVLKGSAALGLEVDKQKKTLFDASNYLDISMQKNKELVILSSSDRFTYNGPQDFLNEGFVHLRWRHLYKNTWQPETFAQYQWDHKRGMLQRFVSGVNVRYDYWHQHKWEFAVGAGIMYESELWDYEGVDSAKIPANPVNQRRNLLKSNSYIKWEGKVADGTVLSLVVFYQAAFTDFFDPRIAGSIKLDVAISHRFGLGLNFQGLYDAKPVVPIFHFYYSFANSLIYRF